MTNAKTVSRQTVPFCLLALLIVLPVHALGPWGVHIDDITTDCAYATHSAPGLFGCKWFNYSNSFVQSNTQWSWTGSSESVPSINYCIYGSIASVMQEHQWPDYSAYYGLDYSGSDKCIAHTWQYAPINTMGCETAPAGVELPSDSCSPYNYADDEITRMYVAAHTATNCANSYGNILNTTNHHRLRWVFRNRLGHPEANSFSVNNYGALSAVHAEVNAGNPVVVLCSGHAYTIDASTRTGTGYYDYDFHMCNFSYPCSYHTSYWASASDVLGGVGGYTPYTFCFPGSRTFSVAASGVGTKGFPFGDDYIRETSSTTRICAVRIRNVSASPGDYRVVIRTTDGYTLFDDDYTGGSAETTSWCWYTVSTSRILNVEVHNETGGTQEYEMVLHDLVY